MHTIHHIQQILFTASLILAGLLTTALMTWMDRELLA